MTRKEMWQKYAFLCKLSRNANIRIGAFLKDFVGIELMGWKKYSQILTILFGKRKYFFAFDTNIFQGHQKSLQCIQNSFLNQYSASTNYLGKIFIVISLSKLICLRITYIKIIF